MNSNTITPAPKAILRLLPVLVLLAWGSVPLLFWLSRQVLPRATMLRHVSDGTQGMFLWRAGVGLNEDGRGLLQTDASILRLGGSLYLGEETAIWLYDVCTGRKQVYMKKERFGWAICAAIAPDRSTLATGSMDNSASVWETATGKELARLEGHKETVYAVAYSRNGRFLTTASHDCVKLWNLSTFAEEVSLPLEPDWSFVAMSEDGQAVALWHSNGPVKVCDSATGRERACIPYYRQSQWSPEIAFSPDFQMAATGEEDGTLRLSDVTTGKERARFQFGTQPYALAFSRDGRMLAACSCEPNKRAADLVARTGWVWIKKVFNDDQGAILLDSANGREIARIPGCGQVAFFPDGKSLAAYDSQDDSIKLWDVPPRRMIPPVVAWAVLGGAVMGSGAWWRMRRGNHHVRRPVCAR